MWLSHLQIGSYQLKKDVSAPYSKGKCGYITMGSSSKLQNENFSSNSPKVPVLQKAYFIFQLQTALHILPPSIFKPDTKRYVERECGENLYIYEQKKLVFPKSTPSCEAIHRTSPHEVIGGLLFFSTFGTICRCHYPQDIHVPLECAMTYKDTC
jgi:hypothetical protein